MGSPKRTEKRSGKYTTREEKKDKENNDMHVDQS
jgi:hypothetical protein